MLRLKELRFCGIGRFAEEQRISFDSLGNLIQIDGLNKNTGGSSGAGKSTIFNAIDFLFGLNSIPSTVLQSRIVDDSLYVEGDFDFDGQLLTIHRGKKLKITLDGKVTTGSSKVTEEKLDEIISIPRTLFRQMLHKHQGEKGFFLNLTPQKTNEFLTDCLGLGKYKNNLNNLENQISNISKMITSLDADYNATKNSLESGKASLLAIGEAPKREVEQSTLVTLKSNMDQSRQLLSTLVTTQQAEEKGLEKSKPFLDVQPFDNSRRKEVEKELSEAQNKSRALSRKEYERQDSVKNQISECKLKQQSNLAIIEVGSKAVVEITKYALELKKLREKVCFTCEQPWSNETSLAKEKGILASILLCRQEMTNGDIATAQNHELQDEIDKLLPMSGTIFVPELVAAEEKENELTNLSKSLAQVEHEYTRLQLAALQNKEVAYQIKYKELRAKHFQDSEQLRGQVDVNQRVFEIALAKFKAYEDSKKRYDSYLVTVQGQITSLNQKLNDLKDQIDAIKIKVEGMEELKRAVKSYLSCSFDQALEEIGDNATKLIRGIPNMSTATIQLDGLRETNEGKVKEEVNAHIHMDGEQDVDIRSLSGGERASTDLAVDLAVIDLIEDRTNKGINIFVLDEPFTGLESINIEMVLEMLKNMNLNKKLIIVDHNPIVKEQISDRITVVREGSSSTII